MVEALVKVNKPIMLVLVVVLVEAALQLQEVEEQVEDQEIHLL